jgi:hypothetical protein
MPREYRQGSTADIRISTPQALHLYIRLAYILSMGWMKSKASIGTMK